jgi:hypothetical protein
MPALLHGEPASIAYDRALGLSLISTRFVARHTLPVSGGQVSCILSVPTLEGSFTYQQRFLVRQDIAVDAVLGSDWLGICRIVSNEGRISFPISSPEYCATPRRECAESAMDIGVWNTLTSFYLPTLVSAETHDSQPPTSGE